jgi:hypothetical protein
MSINCNGRRDAKLAAEQPKIFAPARNEIAQSGSNETLQVTKSHNQAQMGPYKERNRTIKLQWDRIGNEMEQSS